jgi:hypothetical protein
MGSCKTKNNCVKDRSRELLLSATAQVFHVLQNQQKCNFGHQNNSQK